MERFALALALFAITAITATGLCAQTETVLYTFTGGADGGVPYAGLAMDKAGNLYGTTSQYGDGPCTFPVSGWGLAQL